MRLIPVLTAILVSAFLYYIVVERDSLVAFASGNTGEDMSTDASSKTPSTGKSINVIAIHSQSSVVDSAVVLRGETQAARQVQVKAEAAATVVSEPLRKGTFVTKGQVLCELDPGIRNASLNEARARLNEARARVPESKAHLSEAQARLKEALINDNAAEKLSEGGFASDARVASAQANVQAARASVQSAKSGLQAAQAGIESASSAVAAAEREIERLTIHAPFAGVLETDTAELGSLMQTGTLCATIVQLNPIKIVGFVPELDVNKIKTGAMAGARLATGTEVIGQVTFLARSADPLTRTFLVEINVPNPGLAIRDGQTAEIIIASDGADAHLIPQSALTLNDHGLLGVRVVAEDSLVQFVPIELLRDTAEGVWVNGLPDTVDVITIGQEFVIDGVRVTPNFEELTR